MKVPLSKPYVDQEMKDRVLEVIDSGQYILGSHCKEFEKEFAQFIGVKHAVLRPPGSTRSCRPRAQTRNPSSPSNARTQSGS